MNHNSAVGSREKEIRVCRKYAAVEVFRFNKETVESH